MLVRLLHAASHHEQVAVAQRDLIHQRTPGDGVQAEASRTWKIHARRTVEIRMALPTTERRYGTVESTLRSRNRRPDVDSLLQKSAAFRPRGGHRESIQNRTEFGTSFWGKSESARVKICTALYLLPGFYMVSCMEPTSARFRMDSRSHLMKGDRESSRNSTDGCVIPWRGRAEETREGAGGRGGEGEEGEGGCACWRRKAG